MAPFINLLFDVLALKYVTTGEKHKRGGDSEQVIFLYTYMRAALERITLPLGPHHPKVHSP